MGFSGHGIGFGSYGLQPLERGPWEPFFESEVLKEIVLASPSLCRRVGAHIWLPSSSAGKESICKAGDPGSIPGLGRSLGGGPGNSLQYSCLEHPCGQRSLEGYSTWSRKESDRTEQLGTAQHRSLY